MFTKQLTLPYGNVDCNLLQFEVLNEQRVIVNQCCGIHEYRIFKVVIQHFKINESTSYCWSSAIHQKLNENNDALNCDDLKIDYNWTITQLKLEFWLFRLLVSRLRHMLNPKYSKLPKRI